MKVSRRPIYRPDAELDCWVLMIPLRVDVGAHRICVPAGYCSDLASIPRPFWSFAGPPGSPRTDRAAWLHDYLYDSGPRLRITRKQADDLFLAVLRQDGAKRAWLLWAGLRIGGWWAWHKARRRDK